ncbi:MAG: hypothetical protein J7L64_05810 [Acidobacteria bacterium]|nr:hypothetical protein [Acidobacteriota bacterium]
MKKRFHLLMVLVVGVSLVISPVVLAKTGSWKFKLKRDIVYQGKTISQGIYTLSLIEEEGKPYLVIKKKDEVLVKELAIVVQAKKRYPAPILMQTTMTKDNNPLFRIQLLWGDKIYKAFFEYVK